MVVTQVCACTLVILVKVVSFMIPKPTQKKAPECTVSFLKCFSKKQLDCRFSKSTETRGSCAFIGTIYLSGYLSRHCMTVLNNGNVVTYSKTVAFVCDVFFCFFFTGTHIYTYIYIYIPGTSYTRNSMLVLLFFCCCLQDKQYYPHFPHKLKALEKTNPAPIHGLQAWTIRNQWMYPIADAIILPNWLGSQPYYLK